jgi:splicing factor 3B subunit 1
VQQIAILLGCAVLPHLKALVDIVKHGLTDENQKVLSSRLCWSAAMQLPAVRAPQARQA